MAFRVPQFNLLCNIWTGVAGVYPVPYATFSGTPRHASVACCLTLSPNPPMSWDQYSTTSIVPAMGSLLLLPKLTDIRGWQSFSLTPDAVEVPAGSSRYYSCASVEDRGKGYTNEHRVALLFPLPGGWASPYP